MTKQLDKTLEIFGNEILAYGRTGKPNNPKLFTDTKQAILDWVDKEIIGENEPEEWETDSNGNKNIEAGILFRNQLKAEQRARLYNE